MRGYPHYRKSVCKKHVTNLPQNWSQKPDKTLFQQSCLKICLIVQLPKIQLEPIVHYIHAARRARLYINMPAGVVKLTCNALRRCGRLSYRLLTSVRRAGVLACYTPSGFSVTFCKSLHTVPDLARRSVAPSVVRSIVPGARSGVPCLRLSRRRAAAPAVPALSRCAALLLIVFCIPLPVRLYGVLRTGHVVFYIWRQIYTLQRGRAPRA